MNGTSFSEEWAVVSFRERRTSIVVPPIVAHYKLDILDALRHCNIPKMRYTLFPHFLDKKALESLIDLPKAVQVESA